jgi:hypothetical protein
VGADASVYESKNMLKLMVYIPELCACVSTIGECSWPLSLTGKGIEDVAAPSTDDLPPYSGIDSLIAEAANCMMAEVSGGGLVAFVLIAPNAS